MKISEAKQPSRGVFWIVDGEFCAFPFTDDSTSGVAKSGLTYNHKKLWKELNVSSKVPYNYYPRGRVEINKQGKPTIWLNPNISEDLIPDIKIEFGLREEPRIMYDHSEHYRCYLDDGWKADKS